MSLDLRVGSIKAHTFKYVMDGDTSNHVILGLLWLNALRAVASTYRQHVKAVWKERPVTSEATRMPFDRAKLHYAEAALYQEFELEGESRVLLFNATILEQEEDGDEEVMESERPPKIRRITMLDGKVVYKF